MLSLLMLAKLSVAILAADSGYTFLASVVFLLRLAMLMLLVKLMLKVVSMPKLHSISCVQDNHASASCLPLQYMPIEHITWTEGHPLLSHGHADFCAMKGRYESSPGSKIGAELGLSVPGVLSHHGRPSQRPKTCHTTPGTLQQ